MQPNRKQDDTEQDIQPLRKGRMADEPRQPHVTGPTQGFISNPDSGSSGSGSRDTSFNRSNLQTSGMQPSDDFLKEQAVQVDDAEIEQVVKKKKPGLLVAAIILFAVVICVIGLIITLNLA